MGYWYSMITTVTGKNQVTVPASIAAQANVHPGTRFDWEVTDAEHTLLVRILPDRATLAAQLRGAGRTFKKRGSSAVANLIAEREAEGGEAD